MAIRALNDGSERVLTRFKKGISLLQSLLPTAAVSASLMVITGCGRWD